LTPLNAKGYNGELGNYESNFALNHAHTNGWTLQELYEQMVNICKYYGLRYIDLTHCSIVNRINMDTICPDGEHPSMAAHIAIARILASELPY
jgi:hypothetical protein